MKLIQEIRRNCRLELRASERESFIEYHLTATLSDCNDTALAALELFQKVADALLQHRIQPVQEKLYGLVVVKEMVMEKRDQVLRQRGLDRTMPVTWIEGIPMDDSDFVGVQIWGIAPRDGEVCVKTVENPVTGRARLWEGRGFSMLHLPAVRGTLDDGTLAAGRPAQAAQMFSNVGRGLAAHGFSYPEVGRTWIYVAELLQWYVEMNGIRTAHYRPAGLGVPGGVAFPASTGIMGRNGDEACIMDVLAVKPTKPGAIAITPINQSVKQHSSFNYGSSFSRAMSFEIEGRRTVHVSGTASINTAGASTHIGDTEHQCLETLLSISAVLAEQGGSLANITSATLFCKTREAYEAWEQTTRLLNLSFIPKVVVLADVCRDDLLVEMEAVAVI